MAAGEGLAPVAKQLRLSPDHSGDRRKVLARKKGVRSVFRKCSSYTSLSASHVLSQGAPDPASQSSAGRPGNGLREVKERVQFTS